MPLPRSSLASPSRRRWRPSTQKAPKLRPAAPRSCTRILSSATPKALRGILKPTHPNKPPPPAPRSRSPSAPPTQLAPRSGPSPAPLLPGPYQGTHPRRSRFVDRAEGRGPRAAVVTGDDDRVRVGLGHRGRDGADPDLGPELHPDRRRRVHALQVVDALRQVRDAVEVEGGHLVGLR